MRTLFMAHALFTILLLFLPAARLTLWLFVAIFVSSHLVLVTVKCFVVFGIFTCLGYISHLYTLLGEVFAVNKIRAPVLPFSSFLPFSLPFSGTKHSSEDENSEDGWLDLFSP